MRKRWLMRYCLATSLALASVRTESAAPRYFYNTSFSLGSGACASVSWVLTECALFAMAWMPSRRCV